MLGPYSTVGATDDLDVVLADERVDAVAIATPAGTHLDIALAAIREGDVSFGLVMWLTRQLGTRTAWDRYGLDLLSALIARRAA